MSFTFPSLTPDALLPIFVAGRNQLRKLTLFEEGIAQKFVGSACSIWLYLCIMVWLVDWLVVCVCVSVFRGMSLESFPQAPIAVVALLTSS